MTRRSRGFSMLEILVSLAILSVVGLAVLAASQQSAREVRATSDYSLALFLSQKVVEDVLQSAVENPHVLESLEEIDGKRLAVTDGLNPYFAPVEDSTEPWGVLEPGKDLAIESRAVGLHRLYRDFGLTLATLDPPVGTPPNLTDVQIRYDWPGLRDQTRDYLFPVRLADPRIAPKGRPRVADDQAGLDEAIRQALYAGEPGSDLPSAVQSFAGNLAVVRHLGTVLVVVESAVTERSQLASTATTMIAGLPDPLNPFGGGDPEAHIEIAKVYERKAALAWQALVYIYSKDHVATISTNLQASDVGGPTRCSPVYVDGTLGEALDLEQDFQQDLARALRHYAAARRSMDVPGIRPFRRLILERKVLELAQLDVLARQSPDVTFVLDWIDALAAYYNGRVRSVADYLTRERSRSETLDKLQTSNSEVSSRLENAHTTTGDVALLRDRCRQELLGAPPAPNGP